MKSKMPLQFPKRFNPLAIVGLLVAVIVLFWLKGQPESAKESSEAPQEQLSLALEAGKPVLAFYHSDNCEACIEMIDIVNQVYPEFENEVVLIDIDVNDPKNKRLVRKVGLTAIPTEMFYDRSGNERKWIGAMQPDTLHEALADISKEQ